MPLAAAPAASPRLVNMFRLTKCVISVPQGELSLIEQLLPEELLLHIFERLPITALATAQLVCRQWRRVAAAQPLWRRACMCAGAVALSQAWLALGWAWAAVAAAGRGMIWQLATQPQVHRSAC